MVEFHEIKGFVTVTSDTHGTLTFSIRDMRDGEGMMSYMDHIMNAYWNKVGKNKRSYYEEYD